jgi:hypothetical protein
MTYLRVPPIATMFSKIKTIENILAIDGTPFPISHSVGYNLEPYALYKLFCFHFMHTNAPVRRSAYAQENSIRLPNLYHNNILKLLFYAVQDIRDILSGVYSRNVFV